MSSSKGLVIALAVVSVFLIGNLAALYWPRTAQVEVWGEACLERHKNDLKDPKSAYIARSQRYQSGDVKRSVLTISALNSLG